MIITTHCKPLINKFIKILNLHSLKVSYETLDLINLSWLLFIIVGISFIIQI